MNIGWQDATALAAVAAAIWYTWRRLRRAGTRKQRPGCGACSGCPKPAGKPTVISIEPPKKI